MKEDDSVDGVNAAATHALAWLVAANATGLLLSILLLAPQLNPGALTYGRWVPVHLNLQLYGWTALPLVAWLLSIYEVRAGKSRRWAIPAVWAWSFALASGAFAWLAGRSSGKIFLDWRSGSLWSFITALCVLWVVLAIAWLDGSRRWSRMRKRLSGAGIVGLAIVPAAMLFASSPAVYPPVDHTTGGPTGSSLLGSTLFVIGMMLLLPRVSGLASDAGNARRTWIFFASCWLVAIITEAIGGSHFESWQIGAMLCLVPWAWIIPSDWKRFSWPEGTRPWRIAAISWWAILVVTGVAAFLPHVLDRLKFTQGLVAHSHLAMAGFTTSFCALLIVSATKRPLGGKVSVTLWNLAAFGMALTLAWMGWREGGGYSWMTSDPGWRLAGLEIRALLGAVMLAVSARWLFQWIRK